ncbi:MAG: NAD-binding protein [Hyphomicrobiales bacterium]|nr:NAD-binding protein [Hyphomicrobiales bacterium]
MGLGMAQSMVKRGIKVSGFDINSAAIAKLVEAGGSSAASVADVAKNAHVLLVVVVNAVQTDMVLFGEKGAAAAMKKGSVIISSATMAPDDARRLAAKAEALGLLYLDAPISGGAAKAALGQLTVMASGTPEAFKRARPALDAIAATVHELGDAAGIGASFKMVNQLLAGVHIAAACEAVTFAKKLGLDLPTVYKVITASAGNSWMFENRVPHILDGDYAPRSAVEIFTKDLGIVSDMGRREKFPLQIAATALQMFLMAAAAGMERDDDASVARMIAEMTGLELPKASA